MKTFLDIKKTSILIVLCWLITGTSFSGTLTGDSPVCPGTTGYYYFTRDNTNCSSIEWQVYENGSLKTSGWSYNGTTCTVNWSSDFSSGEVRAREKESQTYGSGEYTQTIYCDHWSTSWSIKTVSKTFSEPYFEPMNAAFCNNNTKTVTISSQCPYDKYDYIVPSGWQINGGSNTLNNTSSKSIQVTAPATGNGTYNLNARIHNAPYWVPKLVQLGPVQSSQVNVYKLGDMYDYTLCPSTSYAIIASGPPSTNFTNWYFSGGFSSTYGYGNQAAITTSYNYTGGYISVNAANSCNTSAVTVGRTFSLSYSCPYSMMTAEDVTIYPNPTSDEITVEWPEQAIVTEIIIYSPDKDKLKYKKLSGKEKKTKLSLKDLPPDDYFLHLTDGEHVVKKHIIKK